jgi:anti-anti-sigma regulatory factor
MEFTVLFFSLSLWRINKMNITISKENPTQVTILHLEGKLDGANYESLIEEAKKVYEDGARDLILDLSQLTFISSAGLSAIHQVALLFRGEKFPDQGWGAYHAIDRDRGRGTQEHIKLLSPSEPVQKVLDVTGFDALFEIYTDLCLATASFRRAVPATETRP